MRRLQVVLLVLALAALIAALFFVGTDTGDALWRAGIASLLLDIVVIKLWPTSPEGARVPSEP
jgi:Na+-translocating ferredoxin:NAD+ oxidoreductase RnfD subunit